MEEGVVGVVRISKQTKDEVTCAKGLNKLKIFRLPQLFNLNHSKPCCIINSAFEWLETGTQIIG